MKIPEPDNTIDKIGVNRNSMHTEKEFERYRNRVETILESFTDGFFEVDTQWTVTYWNRMAEELLRRPKEEVLGRNLWESYPDAKDRKFYLEYERCMQQLISTRFEEYLPSRALWFEVWVFPNGQGLSIYFKDITERRETSAQLEDERKKYRELFDHSPLPQWVYDVDSLAFLDVNEAAVSHYGYTYDEFLSMTIRSIRPAEDLPLLEEAIRNISTLEQTKTTLVRHMKKDGRVIDVEIKAKTIHFSGKDARLVLAVDKTDELSAKNAKEQSAAKLREISWMQAHEVRKPLSNLMGLATLLDTQNIAETQRTIVSQLIAQANELDSVVKKTLAKLVDR
jgi:PAS domain S-box-containing protein